MIVARGGARRGVVVGSAVMFRHNVPVTVPVQPSTIGAR
jgi:hypothetical protein